jgi:hypothetical protein
LDEVVERHPDSCRRCSTFAPLPPEVEASRYGPKLSGLVGLLTGSFPLAFSKVLLLLESTSRGGAFLRRKQALRQAVIHRKISHGDQSAKGVLWRSRSRHQAVSGAGLDGPSSWRVDARLVA